MNGSIHVMGGSGDHSIVYDSGLVSVWGMLQVDID